MGPEKKNSETGAEPTLALGARAPWVAPALYAFAVVILCLATGLEALAIEGRPRLDQLFEATDQGIATDPGSAFSIGELSLHFELRASIQLLLGAIVASVVGAGYMLWRTSRVARGPVILLLATTAGAGVAGFMSLSDPEISTSLLRQLVFLTEKRSAVFRDSGLGWLVLLPKSCGDVVCNLIGVGMACTVVFPRRVDAEALARSIRRLRILLYGGAGMLVFGIFAFRFSYAWLLTFVSPADPASAAGKEYAAECASLVAGGTYLFGAFYTLMLAAIYVPPAAVLAHYSSRLGSEAAGEGADREGVREWLKGRDLVISWQGQLARMGALFAPILSGATVQILGAAGS